MAAKSAKKSRKHKRRDVTEIDCFACAKIVFYWSVGQITEREAIALHKKHLAPLVKDFNERHRITT